MTKKILAALLAVLAITTQSRAEQTYYPGSWGEISIPKNILTHADYVRYENARKTSLGLCIVGGVAALGLLKYSSDMRKKANRLQVTEPYLVPGPGGYSIHPIRQSSMDFKARMVSKANGARKAAVVAGMASLLLGALTLSVTF